MTFNLLGPYGHEMFDIDRMRADSKWLLFVCAVTTFVLIFQVFAGAIGKSDALIADSAHSSVDLVTYFFNFYVEYRKTKHHRYVPSYDAFGAMQEHEKRKLDLQGSILSTLLLVGATGWACKEAVERLSIPDELKPASNYTGIGPAMLAFSVVSAAAQVFTLWARGTGYFTNDRVPWANKVTIELPGLSSDPKQLPGTFPDYSPVPYEAYTSPTSNGRHASGNAASSSMSTSVTSVTSDPEMPDDQDQFCLARADPDTRRARRKARKQGGLNLRQDFSVSESGSPCVDTNCTSRACGTAGHGGDSNSVMALVHTVFHPGCGNGQAHENNLNVFGAILHLAADVLRSVAILIVAILIQMGWVSDPADVDAACALFVATFVVLGSFTLFVQIASTWYQPGTPEEPDLELGDPTVPDESYV